MSWSSRAPKELELLNVMDAGSNSPNTRMTMTLSKSTSILQQAGRVARPYTSSVKRLYSAASTSTAYEEFDIVIVGGGPAGLALANALGAYVCTARSHSMSS